MRTPKMMIILLLLVFVTACQKDKRSETKASDNPDQKIVEDARGLLGGIFDIINDIETPCPEAATKLAAYEKDNQAKLDEIAKQYQTVHAAGGDRAAALTKEMAHLVGNNTPAFRRFAKRCPEQSAGLEKTLDKLGGADVKKLASGGVPRGPEHGASPGSANEGESGAAGGGDLEVRAPVAADLKGYLEGIPGEGPKLIAQIITSMGDFHCQLFPDKAPITVANFVGLARGLKPFRNPRTGAVEKRPYYDGIIFHRVIPGFMDQTGDPLGIGTGGPGYKFQDEFSDDLKFDKPGRLAMANAGPTTNGSQFFITEVPTKQLNGKHTIFGQCKEIDLVKKIARVAKDPRNKSRPAEPVVIRKIKFEYTK